MPPFVILATLIYWVSHAWLGHTKLTVISNSLRLEILSGLRMTQTFPRQRPILPPPDTPSPDHRSRRSDHAPLLVWKRPSPWPPDLASS